MQLINKRWYAGRHRSGYPEKVFFPYRWLWLFIAGTLISHFGRSQVTVPVVVHIVSGNPDAVSDAFIRAAIDDLNHAFAHTGPYASGPGANTGIRFCLATTDPDGGITNGITRTQSVLSDFDVDIENNRVKNLISWDNKRYANIWYVEGLKSEIYPMYDCGKWTRMKEAGYATFSDGSDTRDGIVVTGFGILLAHEMGHYLGLKHTFTFGSCVNNDCSVDGDGICDTPPQRISSGSCTSPQNSCFTDTLSGFAKDTVDLNANFMSYAGCANMFTEGQAQKMRDILATTRNSLLAQYLCDPPCTENVSIRFTRDNWSPLPGATVLFNSTSTGATNYQWAVDGVPVGGNSPNLSHTFSTIGKYKITVKAWGANPGCFATYTHYVIVTCGVMARFYPDKRLIAAKAPIMLDTITFTNRSVNATAYRWLMANDTGMSELQVSSDRDMVYPFVNKGNYTVRLIASNGGCADTTETFRFTVDDPALDGTVWLAAAECIQQNKVRFILYVCNNGYAEIPAGTPISFYDSNPSKAGAVKIDSTFLLPDPVAGKCCGKIYSLTLDMKRAGVDTLYAVFNDKGTSIPVKFPNTLLDERDYRNNIGSISGFGFKASILPPTATMQPGDTLQLTGSAEPGGFTGVWSTSVPGLSCLNCSDPKYIAKKADAEIRFRATSSLGCYDTAQLLIKVPPADDLTIRIRQMECFAKDSAIVFFDVCNSFKRGIIPKGLKVSFYSGDPAAGGRLLGPVFETKADMNSLCASFNHVISADSAVSIFAVVNDPGTSPFQLPKDSVMIEAQYANNTTTFAYARERVLVAPADTSILRNTTVPLQILSTIYRPSSIQWTSTGGSVLNCSNCLTPTATVKEDGQVQVSLQNNYGCILTGKANLKILPPDMTIRITGTECYSNQATLVYFTICMNNGYSEVFKNIPVRFYSEDPATGSRKILEPMFLTPAGSVRDCDSFSAIVQSPEGSRIFAVVNDQGGAVFPDTAFQETNITNNIADGLVKRFVVTATPADTFIYRNSTLQLKGAATGGQLTSYFWAPADQLSCVQCLDPIVRVPYTREYVFTGKNQYECISRDTVQLKMFTDGPVNIPNAFTPNGDGKNDRFYVLGSQDIDLVSSFQIYDRYGQLVFQQRNVPPNDPVFGWNGEIRNGERASGSFVYSIVIRFKSGMEQVYKGTVTVIR